MSLLKKHGLLFLCTIFFIVCFLPGLILLAQKWNGSDDYTHALFVVPIIVYMFWQKRECFVLNEGDYILGLPLLFFFFLFYFVASTVQVPTFIFIAILGFIVGCFVLVAGLPVLKSLFVPLLLLALIIPVPNQVLSVLTASLQLWVTEISTSFVQLLSIPVYTEGNVLHIPGKTFQVVEACSGIRSLVSMITLSLIIGFFTLTRKVSFAIFFVAAIPIAVFVNIVRVIAMLITYYYLKLDLTHGTPHTIAGLLLFVFGLFLLFTIQRVLERWETQKISN